MSEKRKSQKEKKRMEECEACFALEGERVDVLYQPAFLSDFSIRVGAAYDYEFAGGVKRVIWIR